MEDKASLKLRKFEMLPRGTTRPAFLSLLTRLAGGHP